MALAVKEGLSYLERTSKRAGADTVALWDGYQEQMYLWRALALLMLPATLLAIGLALAMFFAADTTVVVPPKPEPSKIELAQIPNQEFVRLGSNVANLLTSYRTHEARPQFKMARQFLWQPALGQFEKEWMGKELEIIENTSRSQVFYPSPRQIKVIRKDDHVVVRVPGTRRKQVGAETSGDELVWWFRMRTVPRNMFNDTGLVINNLRVEYTDLRGLAKEDMEEARQMERRKKQKEKETRKKARRLQEQ